jgi:PHD/YefM family antitoxin component YafN of YafNO toxin-antitoxin module
MNIQYVTDDKGNRVAVQIPLDQWELIKSELESYDATGETAEILADPGLMESIKRGREQARRKVGRRIEEIDV